MNIVLGSSPHLHDLMLRYITAHKIPKRLVNPLLQMHSIITALQGPCMWVKEVVLIQTPNYHD